MSFLQDKVIAITGGGRGIGRGIALDALKKGAKVAVLDINVAHLASLPEDMLRFEGDVSVSQDLEAFYAKVTEHFGQLDYVVANAVSTAQEAGESEEAFFERMLQVNCKGMYYTMKLAVPHLNADAAMVSIIAASAIHDIQTMSGAWAEYTAIKQAVKYLSRSLAAYNDRGIRINMVSPGFIAGERVDAISKRAGWQPGDLENTAVVKRMGKVKDVSSAVFFLLSPEASYITGNDLWVDGGWAINGAKMP